MDQQLKEALIEYKDHTIKLIEALEKEDFDSLEPLLSLRQEKIDVMDRMEYSKNEFVDICSDLNIVNIEQKCSNLLLQKRDELKSNINKFTEAKSANRSYRATYSVDSLFFNKKI